jgi:hypothetical protein
MLSCGFKSYQRLGFFHVRKLSSKLMGHPWFSLEIMHSDAFGDFLHLYSSVGKTPYDLYSFSCCVKGASVIRWLMSLTSSCLPLTAVGFESWQGLWILFWILSCQLAYWMSVVLLSCLNNAQNGTWHLRSSSNSKAVKSPYDV